MMDEKYFADLRCQARLLREGYDCWSKLEDFFFHHEGCLLPIDLLLLKSAALQLSGNDDGRYDLKDAENALLQALDLNKNDIQSKVDLAYFYYAVMDDAIKSIPLFTSAIELCESSLEDAICGKAEAIEEVDGLDAAICFLQHSSFITDKIQELLEGFIENKKNESQG